MASKKNKKTKLTLDTFTKVWVNRIMYLSWICIFWCFILASFGKDQIAEDLAMCIVVNIIGVFIGYLTKSFFETREQKRMESNITMQSSGESCKEDEFIDV